MYEVCETSLARHHTKRATCIREGLGICALFLAAVSWKNLTTQLLILKPVPLCKRNVRQYPFLPAK